MEATQTIEDFYRGNSDGAPVAVSREVGHFNVFRLDDFVGPGAKPMPYSRKDYFKISLIVGRNRLHYADRTIEFERNGLIFANPQVPYNYEALDGLQSGFFCIFTPAFFRHFNGVRLQDYPAFKPGGQPVYSLSDGQVDKLAAVFERMFEEIGSEYAYKDDVIRNHICELIHEAHPLASRHCFPSCSNGSSPSSRRSSRSKSARLASSRASSPSTSTTSTAPSKTPRARPRPS